MRQQILTRSYEHYLTLVAEELLKMAVEGGAEAGLHDLSDAPFERLVTARLAQVEQDTFSVERRTVPRRISEDEWLARPDAWAWLRHGLIGAVLAAAVAVMAFRMGVLTEMAAWGTGAILTILYISNVFPLRRWYRRVRKLRMEEAAAREEHLRNVHEARIANIHEYVLAAYHHEKLRAEAVRNTSRSALGGISLAKSA